MVRQQLVGRMAGCCPTSRKKGVINMLKRFVEGATLPEDGQHLRWQYFLNRSMEARLFQDTFRAQINGDPFWQVREYAGRCDARTR